MQDGPLVDLLLRGNPTLAHADGDKPVEWLSEIGWADMQRLVVISDVFAELPALLKVPCAPPFRRLLGKLDATSAGGSSSVAFMVGARDARDCTSPLRVCRRCTAGGECVADQAEGWAPGQRRR
jgi:hypothetical protein